MEESRETLNNANLRQKAVEEEFLPLYFALGVITGVIAGYAAFFVIDSAKNLWGSRDLNSISNGEKISTGKEAGPLLQEQKTTKNLSQIQEMNIPATSPMLEEKNAINLPISQKEVIPIKENSLREGQQSITNLSAQNDKVVQTNKPHQFAKKGKEMGIPSFDVQDLETAVQLSKNPMETSREFLQSFIQQFNIKNNTNLTFEQACILIRKNVHNLQISSQEQDSILKAIALFESNAPFVGSSLKVLEPTPSSTTANIELWRLFPPSKKKTRSLLRFLLLIW